MRASFACCGAAAAMLVLFAAGRARAGNDDELLVGSRAAMTSGAVSATVNDGSAIWYNPAGLGAMARSQIDVSGTVYTLRLYSARDFITLTDGSAQDASVAEFVSVPNQITFVRQLAPGVSLGLGHFVPSVANFRVRELLETGDAQDGAQFQVAIGLADVQHAAAAAVGFQLASGLRLGFSLIGTYEAVAQSVSYAGVVHLDGASERALSTTGLVTLDQVGGEIGAGLQLALAPRWRAALALRSPRAVFYNGLDASIATSVAMTPEDGGALEFMSGLEQTSEGGSQLGLLRAGRIGVGVAHDYATESWVALEVDLQPGMTNDAVGVARQFVVNARAGVYHALTPALALGGGLFTDRAPDRPSSDPVSSRGDFYGGTLGLELSNAHRLAPGERADSLIFSTAFALRYAFSESDVNTLQSDPEGEVTEWFQPSPGTLYVHEFGFYVGSGLRF